MSYETIADGNAEYAPSKWVRYTLPEEREIKENEHHLKKDGEIEGWYLGSEQREGNFGMRWTHTLVDAEGVHWKIPDNSDVTKAFLSDRIVKGAKTRFTYLGKTPFKTKSGQTAKAVKALIEQDRTSIMYFTGAPGCEVLSKTKPEQVSAPLPKEAAASITSADVPF